MAVKCRVKFIPELAGAFILSISDFPLKFTRHFPNKQGQGFICSYLELCVLCTLFCLVTSLESLYKSHALELKKLKLTQLMCHSQGLSADT